MLHDYKHLAMDRENPRAPESERKLISHQASPSFIMFHIGVSMTMTLEAVKVKSYFKSHLMMTDLNKILRLLV